MSLGLCAAVLLAAVGYTNAQSSFNDKAPGKVIHDVVFESLPVSEVITFLRDKFPQVNFVTVGPVERVRVSLELRNVRLGDILLAMQLATDDVLDVDDAGESIIAIRASATTGKSQKVVRAFSLRNYLERVIRPLGPPAQGNPSDREKENLDRKLNAYVELEKLLQSTWHDMHRADHGENPTQEERQSWPKLNFHIESVVLVAIGEDRQLEVIDEIIAAFEK